jgi:hypothetical protein
MKNFLCKAVAASLAHTATMSAMAVCGAPPAFSIDGAAQQGAGTKVVSYSNFSSGEDVYNPALSYGISGSQSAKGYAAVALQFFPNGDAFATKVQLPLRHVGPAQPLRVSLNEDAGGLPGAVLASGLATSMPADAETCCKTTTVKLGPVPMDGHTFYWLVVRPETADANLQAVWKLNCDGIAGNVAVDQGAGWTASFTTLPAARLVGKR